MNAVIMMKIKNIEVKKSIIRMAVPASLEVVLQMLLGLIDVVFISWVGESELAGVGIANRVSNLILMICGTIGVGGAILISQYYGKRDESNISKISANLFQYALLVTLVFGFPLYLFSGDIIQQMGAEGDVVVEGQAYFKIIVISMAFALLSVMSSSILRAVGDTKTPMVVNTVCLLINTVLNYVLIFGFWSIPAMGVEGCGYATLIARVIAFMLLFGYLYTMQTHVRLIPDHLYLLNLVYFLES